MSGLRTVLSSAAMVAVLGVGIGMWCVVPPGDDRRRELVKNLPESDPMRLEDSRKRNALVMQALKEAGETNDNIARELRRPVK
ncbi:ubiquinol-cytochrome-c reductase complex assembly factor 3 [Channa argus]|uniref:ubiquinol-cytochrome-c reductase complex assembly factor 3 n=1 Tax=Channa argus TaxID=215402 RepID=UPI0029465836|nr:hypothetical protein Q8A73_012332 [Channa argus]